MHPDDLDEDCKSYYRFTGPQRFDRAIHTLEGLVKGVGADGHVNDHELTELTRWVGEHEEFAERHPFNEIVPVLRTALTDGIFDSEERYDLLWLCEKISTNSEYYDTATADMQRLQGILAGIIADKNIEVHELRLLQAWIDEHSHLKTCWPYDEIEAVLINVMKDEVVDDAEHAALMAFFCEFTSRPGHRSLVSKSPQPSSTGICAVCPEVVFPDRLFCFTGSSKRATRKAFESMATERGAKVSSRVVRDLHYLVVGADGNPCWAYACYGRKIESAMKFRRDGVSLVLVHEYDFWDAVA